MLRAGKRASEPATLESLRAVTSALKDLVVCAARLDRELSTPDALARVSGERWDEERGLNDHGYIVPGAGGTGQVLRNARC